MGFSLNSNDWGNILGGAATAVGADPQVSSAVKGLFQTPTTPQSAPPGPNPNTASMAQTSIPTYVWIGLGLAVAGIIVTLVIRK